MMTGGGAKDGRATLVECPEDLFYQTKTQVGY